MADLSMREKEIQEKDHHLANFLTSIFVSRLASVHLYDAKQVAG